jgi:hypothetical protein
MSEKSKLSMIGQSAAVQLKGRSSMRDRTKAAIMTLTIFATLLVSVPAANAAEYWASSAKPSKVRSNDGTIRGEAYGRGWNSTVNVNSKATYRRVSGDYSIYVRAQFAFYAYNYQTERVQWTTVNTKIHNGSYSKSWTTNTRQETLSTTASQSRVSAQACTEVPFLVPGNCTGFHIMTNPY